MPSASQQSGRTTSYGSIPPSDGAPAVSRTSKRTSSSSLRALVDLTSIEDGFSRWVKVVGGKMGRKGKRRQGKDTAEVKRKELMRSVFGAGGPDSPAGLIPGAQPQPSEEDFLAIVGQVKTAIAKGVHPKLIAKGSSGSYFARDPFGQIVAVFKPKDEEPYGAANPKTVKWIHRTFFSWVGFGRACLIPNLSYISEAAASHLDRRLGLALVPRTDLASFSTSAFFYDWIDRTSFKTKNKPLPEKVGSFQLFMRGFTDASQWLKEHPWPNGLSVDEAKAKSDRHYFRRCLRIALGVCGSAGAETLDGDEREAAEGFAEDENRRFKWTQELKDEFCEELQKLVALDFLMLNTDRGLDNFMIRYSSAPPTSTKPISRPPSPILSPTTRHIKPSKISFDVRQPHLRIAAIDNSLSFPHHHPNGWRSYPYGWLFLPVPLIGRPFSESIRAHLIPLLSSPAWWEKTITELRQLFGLDSDFNETMYQRQVAVLKGQGYNLLQSLKQVDEGPLELCRRPKVEIWTEEIEVPDSAETEALISETLGRDVPPALEIPPPHLHPEPTSTAQDAAQAMIGTTSAIPTRPRPLSESPASSWRSFEGVSGVSVMKLLDKESRRRKKSRRSQSRPSAPLEEVADEDERAQEDSRGAFSDGEDGPSVSQRGRPRRLNARSTLHRPINGLRHSPADSYVLPIDLSSSLPSLTPANLPLSPPSGNARPSAMHKRLESYRSAQSWTSTDWLLAENEEERDAVQDTRIVLVEKVKEIQGGAFFFDCYPQRCTKTVLRIPVTFNQMERSLVLADKYQACYAATFLVSQLSNHVQGNEPTVFASTASHSNLSGARLVLSHFGDCLVPGSDGKSAARPRSLADLPPRHYNKIPNSALRDYQILELGLVMYPTYSQKLRPSDSLTDRPDLDALLLSL